MLTFKDLIIRADNNKMEKFISELTNKISSSPIWDRKDDKQNLILHAEKIYAFQRKKDNKLPAAGLSIFPKDNGVSWYVPNVVPIEYKQLSYQEYNDILTEFYDLFVKPISVALNINTEISTGNISAQDILGERAARALSLFSDCANKSTGSSHPNDRERWLAFILMACTDKEHIDTGLLQKILIEQGWDEYGSNKLMSEFEFAKDVIDYIKENS